MPRNAPLPRSRPETLKLLRAPPEDWRHAPEEEGTDPSVAWEYQGLPVHPDTAYCLHGRKLSAHAVISVVPNSGEVRIPYIRTKRKGEFAPFMDELVTRLRNPVRFTNVFMSDSEAADAYDAMDHLFGVNRPDWAERLDKVLDRFDHEPEYWHDTWDDPADTLVGQWDPDRGDA